MSEEKLGAATRKLVMDQTTLDPKDIDRVLAARDGKWHLVGTLSNYKAPEFNEHIGWILIFEKS